MTDAKLLAEYARTGSGEIFAEIARRHAGLVHAACLRILGDAHAAEDAAQAAFLVFLRKGRALPKGTVLAGWLHRTARNCALRMREAGALRARREEEAAAMAKAGSDGGASWDELKPHLDGALDALPAAQRDALALRYLRGLSRAEVAAELGCPERTVESRLRLGIEKLRERLARLGAAVPAAALGAMLAERALEAAPAGLVASIQAVGLGTAAAPSVAAGVAKGVLKMMFWAKVKLAAAVVAAVVVGAGGGAVAVKLAAGEPAKPEAPPLTKVERKGPLAALPSAPGPHIEKIKALGDNQWLKIEAPAPDPKWGSAHSVSWGGKMAYASDLRGGFIYGEDQHGWYNHKTGYYYDSLWFYDLNANRWICCYPGTHVPTFAQKIKDGEFKVDDNGNLVDRDGQPLPVAPLIHPYGMVTYDPDAHKLAVGSSWSRHHHSAGTLKDGYAAWDEQLKSKNIKGQVMSPWFYDTVNGKWEIYPAKGNHGGIFGGFEYIPSKKEYFECSYSRQADAHFFDPRTQAWRRSPAAGGPSGIDASASHDTKRDRVYYGGSEYAGAKNPADNFFSYDLKTDVWKKLNVSADRWKVHMGSFNALFHYDSAGDRLVSILTPANPKDEQKVYAYDPETDQCEEPRPLPPEVIKDTEGCLASGFYDPELNAHFCLYSNGCNTPYRSLWVYRYKRAPEKK